MYVRRKSKQNFKNIKWYKARAEKLPVKNNTYDFYTISYGIRNVSDINLSLKEALRVLKPGGRFMCLEFSKIDNEMINLLYKKYSKIIPFVGKYIVGSSKPYDYLIKSINEFYTQDELANLIKIYPQIQIQINGYTDYRGSDSHNLILSKERIDNVRAEFIKAGISNQRFQTHAHGENKASAYEGDTESYVFDRRVTISLTLNQEV